MRYRCRTCHRTFNDLTGTPIARTKRLLLWGSFAGCMGRCESVRLAARTVGVHTTTAFRWRHLMLDGLRAQDHDHLSGWVELGLAWFAYSEKGRRPIGRPARRRGLHEIHARTDEGVKVLIACDRSRNVVTAATGRANSRRFTADEIGRALSERLEPDATLLAADGWYGGPAIFADRIGATCIDTRRWRGGSTSPLAHTRTTVLYRLRLQAWIERFRGVATRYLPNYLVWHRTIDRQHRLGFATVALQWPLGL